ncbi:MAG TPA: N-acetylmuramoyl-L-alanine amidase [Bacteroidales bacterium]|nr:N-acetylmuramoyl-L-alanine amidase [Bacteroidales bacterium]
MKYLRIVPLFIILIVLISGCKTTKVIVPGPAEAEPQHNSLKAFAYLDLNDYAVADMSNQLPKIKTDLKKKVRDLVTEPDIDGLCLIIAGQSSDLIEDLAVEAMLLKPYLIISLVYSGESGHQNATECVEHGIADMMLSEAEFKSAAGDLRIRKLLVPDNLKKTIPQQVIGLNFSAFFPDNPGGQTLSISQGNKTKVTDTEGYIGFISPDPDTIVIETTSGAIILPTENWSVPYKYSILPDHSIIRKSPWVEFRMMPKQISEIPEYDFLCKTDYPATVMINGNAVKQYRTGIFFSTVKLNEGSNRVRATVITPDSLSAFYEGEFIYKKVDRTRKPYPLWIDARSVEPASEMDLLPEDIVRVSFRGSLGQDGYAVVNPGRIRIRCVRENFGDYSIYRADLPLRKLATGGTYNITLGLVAVENPKENKTFEFAVKNGVRVREEYDFPLVRIKNENSRLTYNLGAPRLGGPIRSELGPGVVLKANGKIGRNYRVRLSLTEHGFISQEDVEIMPAETVTPSYYITSMSCGPSRGADVLTIPYPDPVAYEVFPDPDQKRIVVTLFGVQTSSTWVTHRAGLKIIDKITWDQTTPETYKVYVNLTTPDIWGYDLRVDGKRLVLRVKYPPVYDLNNEKPLTGMKIAIEAGHGGSGMGAIGLSGLVEKDINLDLSFKLGELCRSMGAEIVQVRDSDKDMLLLEKRNIAVSSGADMLISIHANAGGRGYLSVGGTSTYWHNPFWAPLAERIYDRLLETGLEEFGVVGSFNYTVTRVSQIPSILVEQAFMTNAGDEEKLADPAFRQLMAEKIYEGIVDYLRQLKE